MKPKERNARLVEALWGGDAARSSMKLYAVLDGARDDRIYPAVLGCKLAHACLYSGKLPREMLETAPYLIHLTAEAPFTEELLREGWGNSWGVFAGSTGSLEELRRHFRSFLKVKDETGKSLIFRWYDPRVFRVYLPTCNAGELRAIFGPVSLYWSEAESADALLQYRRDGEALGQTRIDLAAAGV
jgi:hypothetical protein